jgi:TRAP-type C4-dicarboxylate transport system permease small subunit
MVVKPRRLLKTEEEVYMKVGQYFQNINKILQKFELFLGTTCFIVLFSLMIANCFGRYVLERPILWAEELNNYLFVWFGFLGAAYVMSNDRHIKVTAILDMLPPLGRYIIVQICNLIFITMCIIFMEPLYRLLRVVPFSGLLRIPLIYVYSILPLSFGLMAFHIVNNIVQDTLRLLIERKKQH